MIESRFVDRVAEEVRARPAQVDAAIRLFDKGATVPFIARYRKDVTGSLDEVKLELIEERNAYYIALINRRDAILDNIAKQDKLTDALRQQIDAALDHTTLEDLYLPFKKQRRTKASIAVEQGLEPLADYLWAQSSDGRTIEEVASTFMNAEKRVSSPEEALDGARHILSERVSVDAGVRAELRAFMLKEGSIISRATKNAGEQKTKFEAYYDYVEPLSKVPSHRLLAVLRGTRMGLLRSDITIDDETAMAALVTRFLTAPGTPFEEHVKAAVEDSYRRLLRPSIENEVLGLVRQQAEEEAIRVFRENARNLLLSPPAGSLRVMGVDPGLRSGCKLAVVDNFGSYLESTTIHLSEEEAKREAVEQTLHGLIQKHQVEALAIGNGTGSREAARYIEPILKKLPEPRPFLVFVNEAGASVYSASKVARQEFPDLDVTVRGAISIARRLQDPLAELVKIEPRSVGVGQYQHDVNPRRLKEGLHRTVETCVNVVGVDINSASLQLLRYISGIQMGTAQNIIEYRTNNGGFRSRRQLLEVSGIGERTYEQAAGFLRIAKGENPLDATAIHPEAYVLVEQMVQDLGVPLAEVIENPDLLKKVDFAKYSTETIGKHTLEDIRQELLKPGRDPRTEFKVPKFLEGVHDLSQLAEGMELEGVITNVTDFGAFVDCGVHQDGLVHLSELANRYVRDPREVVKVGEIVKVKVVKVDKELNRISLSMKALMAPPERPARGTARQGEAARPDSSGRRASTGAPDGAGARQGGGARPSKPSRPAAVAEGESARRPPRDKRRGKPAPPAKRPRPVEQQKSAEPFNTVLSDQLAALRDKLGG